MYIGNGYCIEAKGINYGTIKSKVSATAWTHVLKLCDIDYTKVTVEEKKSGWYEEDGGWRYYNGDTGNCVCNAWAEVDGKWYWFDGAGMMVTNVWYEYKENWFYLGSDGAMVKGLLQADGKWYFMNDNGEMVTEPVVLTPDDNGALQYDENGALKYPGLVE